VDPDGRHLARRSDLALELDPDGARGSWECVMEAEVPGIPGRTASYIFDEQSIRPRYGPDPPSG